MLNLDFAQWKLCLSEFDFLQNWVSQIHNPRVVPVREENYKETGGTEIE